MPVIFYLLFSMRIAVFATPFENEVRGERVKESSLYMPPFVPPKRGETGTNSEEEENREPVQRELADKEFSEKLGNGFGEEFFKRLERELAMETARHNEKGSNIEELLDREVPEEYEEMPEEYTGDDNNDAVEKEPNTLHNRELLEENGLTDEEMKREFDEEEAEGLRSPEEIDSTGMKEEGERKSNREVREETAKENTENEREAEEDENKENEDDYPRKLFRESEEKFKKEQKDKRGNEEHEEKVEEAEKSARSFIEEDKAGIHESERIATPQEKMLIRMLSYPRERLSEWKEKSGDNRLRGLGEKLYNEAKERPKHMREREAEREGERLDRYGNEERELEMLRERQRERAIGEGLKVREKEIESRKQREEKGPFGVSRQHRERFRFRSRSE